MDAPARYPFYGGLTRTGLMFGVPTMFFASLLLLTAYAFLITSNVMALLSGLPVYAICYLICQKDAGLFGVLWCRIAVMPIFARNSDYWQGRSYMP